LDASVASIDDELVDSESRAQEITDSLVEEIKEVQESRKELNQPKGRKKKQQRTVVSLELSREEEEGL
jgi:hypothetical protein